jgi:hypothetical protein
MRRLRLAAVVACLCAGWACDCQDEPAAVRGPFAALAERLPAEADLIVLIDVAALNTAATELQQQLMALPLVRRHPRVRQLLEEQRGLLRSLLGALRGRLGLDPLQDLERVAAGVVLAADGAPRWVAAAEGALPAQLLEQALPDVAPRQVAGQAVYAPLPDGPQLAMPETGLLLAASAGDLQPALQPEPGRAAGWAAAHPGMLNEEAAAVVQLSLRLPDWLRRRLQSAADQPGVSTLLGVERVQLELGEQVLLAADCRDDGAAERMQQLLAAEANLVAGGQHLMRGIGFLVLALDLQALPELQPALAETLADREALRLTLEALFPELERAPPVTRRDQRVELRIDSGALRGMAMISGLLAAVAVPAFTRYLALSREARP